MIIALLVVLGIFIAFAVAVGCELSDAQWAIQQHIDGHKFSEMSASNKERVYRAKLGAELLLIFCILMGIGSLVMAFIILMMNF